MSPALPSLLPRSIYRAVAVVLVFFLLQQFWYFHQPVSVTNHLDDDKTLCKSLRGLEDIFVVLRTGATEAPKKLPPHFATTLRCVPHYALYSDYEEDIDGHHVYNALDEVDPNVIANHPDFEYYRRLQAGGREAFSAEEIAQWSSAKNTNGGRDSPGWRLDKWKFLPLADKAYHLRPDAKWYIFIESDTFMMWRSLLEFLSHFDASKPHYLGQQMQIGDIVFAYGGAGFAISNPALKKAVERRRSNLKFYDDFTGGHWAGDCVLGKALLDAGVNLHWSFPTLNGDAPAEMDFNTSFGGEDKKPWCYYASSYHHLPAADYPQFASFEQKWNQRNAFLLRHRDVFRFYVLPNIASERVDWDNVSGQEQKDATTFGDCRNICENQVDCLQFSLSGQTCRTSTVVKLGHQVASNPAQPVRSGWILDRVKEFTERMDKTCSHQAWMLP
ncbi:glycosyltransferase family 31 protein [Whalleya microplaca]|nr:glycosyltransferase family 31 protein [Whalleya microplaca]